MQRIEFKDAREGDISLALHYFNNRCAYCSTKLTREYGLDNSMEWEHYKSISEQIYEDDELIVEGGLQNRVPSCRKCNRQKSDHKPEAWIRKAFPDKADEIIEKIEMYFALQEETLFR